MVVEYEQGSSRAQLFTTLKDTMTGSRMNDLVLQVRCGRYEVPPSGEVAEAIVARLATERLWFLDTHTEGKAQPVVITAKGRRAEVARLSSGPYRLRRNDRSR